jgi:hypothetical protein
MLVFVLLIFALFASPAYAEDAEVQVGMSP